MNKNKALAVIIVLLAGIAVIYGFPRPKYKGVNILSTLKIPLEFADWQGKDVSGAVKLGNDERYNFISGFIARSYQRQSGENLNLFILDAGNFHNPKVCFRGAGFTIKEGEAREFVISGRVFKTQSLFVERSGESYMVTYWMCINKNIVDWIEQKTRQLFYSLFNKKKAGLMMRIDMPARPETAREAYDLMADFMQALSSSVSGEENDYIFGNKHAGSQAKN